MSPGGAAVAKRSLSIAGHRTSVSLEEGFWQELRRIAEGRGQSVAGLVAAVDRERAGANLSSALRVFVLDQLRAAGPEGVARTALDGDGGRMFPRRHGVLDG